MICYQDRTWCPYWDECEDGLTCHRAMTPNVISRAEMFGLPVSRYGSKPDCFIKLRVKEDKK